MSPLNLESALFCSGLQTFIKFYLLSVYDSVKERTAQALIAVPHIVPSTQQMTRIIFHVVE